MLEPVALEPSAPDAGMRDDAPIGASHEDALGRGRIADALARSLVSAAPRGTFVMGLHAPWGTGKTSFLNLLHERLTDPAGVHAIPIVIRFNPWNYGSPEQLVRMFFTELADGIGGSVDSALGHRVGKTLGAIGGAVSRWSAPAGVALKVAGTVLQSQRALDAYKADLNECLRELGRRVVVFVDDLDRLERDELAAMFRMVRLNTDFENVTYLLAFDRDVVERNLSLAYGIRGRDYLEKIIQGTLDLPAPGPGAVQAAVEAALSALDTPARPRFAAHPRWAPMFNDGLRGFLRQLRQVKYLTNGVRLTWPLVGDVADPVDFVGVECLRVFEPDVYQRVARSAEALTPVGEDMTDTHRRIDARAWMDETVALAPEHRRDAVRGLLLEIFPGMAIAHRDMPYAGEADDALWRREHRVGVAEHFAMYFVWVPSEG